MEHQKILNLLNEANNTKFEHWNIGTLSMIIQKRIIVQEMKLPVTQKF